MMLSLHDMSDKKPEKKRIRSSKVAIISIILFLIGGFLGIIVGVGIASPSKTITIIRTTTETQNSAITTVTITQTVTNTMTNTNTNPITTTTTLKRTIGKIDDTIQDFRLAIRVINSTENSQLYNLQKGNKLLILNVWIKNIGTENFYVNLSNFHVRDTNEVHYDYSFL